MLNNLLISAFRRNLSVNCCKMAINIGGMRISYRNPHDTFDIQNLASKNPYKQFTAWFEEAKEHKQIEEPNAMCIATATPDGRPSNRIVLLKSFGDPDEAGGGFVFFTNYDSRKAKELESNPFASIVIYWEPLRRSVRIEGRVERVDENQSDEYFLSRPFDSQIGAIVSHQSSVIPSRDVLTSKEAEVRKECAEGSRKLQRPENWGGYRVIPEIFEFWQGQSNRIHDRLRFRIPAKDDVIDPELSIPGEKGWIIERLSP